MSVCEGVHDTAGVREGMHESVSVSVSEGMHSHSHSRC